MLLALVTAPRGAPQVLALGMLACNVLASCDPVGLPAFANPPPEDSGVADAVPHDADADDAGR